MAASEPADGDERVRCLLLPLAEGAALLPNTAVAEVAIHARLQDAPDDPDWLCGRADWRGLQVPVVALEAAWSGTAARRGGERRIAVLNTLNGNPALPFLAIAIAGTPRLLQVSAAEVGACGEGAEAGILCRLQVASDEAVIPDLDAMEQWLVTAGTAAP